MRINFFKCAIIFIAWLLFPLILMAQPTGGGPGGGGPPVPITGIEYLLGGGIVIGIRYLMKKKQS